MPESNPPTVQNDLPWEELKERFGPMTPEEETRIPRKLPYMVFIIDDHGTPSKARMIRINPLN